MIQLVGSEDKVISATTASEGWLKGPARIVGGKTVLEVGGKEHTLPRADLRRLVQEASRA